MSTHDFRNKLLCLRGLLFLARELCGGSGKLAKLLSEAETIARQLEPVQPKRTQPLLAALLLFLYMPALAGSFKGMAKELVRDAGKAGISRVAVLPFEPMDGSGARQGWSVAEQLTTQLVRSRRIQAVERSLINKLLEEHRLARTGLVNSASVKKLGAVFAVDGVISGTFIAMGRRLKVNARLIHAETGLIVSACETDVDRELFDIPGFAETPDARPADYAYVPAPVLDVEPPSDFLVEVPSIFPDEIRQLRDAPTGESCTDAAERVDRLESQILDLKARYWALRLRQGLSSANLKVNPGSTITDPGLKQRFYGRIKYWHEQGAIPELTPTEVRRFVAIDQRAFSLYRECGI